MAVQATEREMKPGYALTYTISHGTHSGAPKSKVSLDFECQFAIDSDEIDDAIKFGASRLASILLTTSSVTNFSVRQHAHTVLELGINKKNKRRGKLTVYKGERELAPGTPPMPRLMTLRFEKEVRRGNPGQIEVRGCLSADDVEYDSSGSVSLKVYPGAADMNLRIAPEFRNFGPELQRNWPAGDLVMPDSPLSPFDYSRTIVGIGEPSIGEKQTRNKFTTVERQAIETTQRKARAVLTEITNALRNGGAALTDVGFLARLAQLGLDYKNLLLSLPLDIAAEMLLEEGNKRALALNEATDLPGE
jgi:hypothetical protein